MNLSSNVKITKLANATAAGTDAVNSTAIDMTGFDGVLFLTTLGTANAGNSINLAEGDASNGSDAADLAGTKIVPAANNQAVWIDAYKVAKPTKRYLRLEVARGASTTVGEIWCIQYEGRVAPCNNLTDNVIIGELHISPAEGTA